MWQRLMDWLPDLRVGVFEVRDFVSLGLAVVGAWLAYLATTIAAKQDRLLEAQRRHSTRLHLRHWDRGSDGQFITILLEVANVGRKGTHGFQWEIYVPWELSNCLTLIDGTPAVPMGGIQTKDNATFLRCEGFRSEMLFPGSSVLVARVQIPVSVEDVKILWQLRHHDGENPGDEELVGLRFEMTEPGRFATIHETLEKWRYFDGESTSTPQDYVHT
jgi:hypothetical protein